MNDHGLAYDTTAITILLAVALFNFIKRMGGSRALLRPDNSPLALSALGYGGKVFKKASFASAICLEPPPVPTQDLPLVVAEKDALPILIVEQISYELESLSAAVRQARFVNPVVTLPDNDTLAHYLEGQGAYSNRRKYPLPAIILQDVTLPKLPAMVTLPWMPEPAAVRLVIVTVLSGAVEARHFESAIPFGPNASLCKLEHFHSLEDLFKVLQRACLDD